MSFEVIEYIVWVIEIAAEKLFDRDKTTTYNTLKNKFYTSKVCKGISDKRTGMFTFAPREIIDLFNEEANGVDILKSGNIRKIYLYCKIVPLISKSMRQS